MAQTQSLVSWEDEWRQWHRLPVDAVVSLALPPGSSPAMGITVDVSEGGLCVDAAVAPPLGARLRIEINGLQLFATVRAVRPHAGVYRIHLETAS